MLVNIECENKNGGKTMLMKKKRKAKETKLFMVRYRLF